MTSYPHRISILVPVGLAPDANQLALALGQQPGDANTFVGDANTEVPGDPPTPAYAKGTRVSANFISAVTGPDPLPAPDHAPDVDLAAAERARAALSFTGPAAPDTISVRLDWEHDAAMADMGVMEP
ncbi:UNVERIFIED_CONTAM: hypothetical protein BEN50_12820 [Euhalothece sp. KZN 001]